MFGITHGINILGGKILILPIIILFSLGILLIAGTALGRRHQVAHDATSPGIYGVTGRMGGGKSYFLTWMATLQLARHRPVFCTYEVNGYMTFDEWLEKEQSLQQWTGAVLIEPSIMQGDGKGWHQIIQVPPNCMVIVDEAHGWWPSRAYAAPTEVTMWISTLRHRRITFFWATQWTDAVAKWIRALSFGIWECENFKAGHRYTLYHPRKINGKIGSRQYDARIILKRKDEVMAMYDTHNTAAHSVQWGSDPMAARGHQD